MKKVFLLLLMCLSFYSYGQTCGYVEDLSGSGRGPLCNLYAANTNTYCIKVKFHIVRDDNQTNGFDYLQLPGVVTAINNSLGLQGITVTSLGYDYINSTTYNSPLEDTELSGLGAINSASGQLDFYLVNQISGSVIGYAQAGNVFVENAYAATTVSAHEIGHVFGLGHVNQGNACSGGENSSNCQSCLDLICDTFASNSSNIMYSTYIPPQTAFTAGQGVRMRNTIECNYQSLMSNSCSVIVGDNRLCATGTKTYTLQNHIPGSTVTWSVTSNLQIVSSTATTVTVQGATSTTSGMATITANVGGTIITKSVFVGKPSFNVVRDNVEYCEGSWHYLYIEIVNFDTTTPTTGYTYSFVTPPGITYTAMGNNHFRFRLPQNYVGYFELLATVTNSCGSSQSYTEQDVKLCGTFTYQYPRGVAESGPTASSKRYAIFPNPADDAINIALVDPELHDSTRISAELYDMLGQSKGRVDIIDGQAVMDVSRLYQGIYVVKINIDGVVETHQVMIK
ncbi:T9SS type A sorting domain-containing protein [Flavobacterium sp.]|uniref:T9SS type A sorting domain-containing protein n=1 Tax=Flavobacterium sp. TaxID=239 RepID=UPI0039E5C377